MSCFHSVYYFNFTQGLKVVRNKKVKILIPDNIFFLYLIIIKPCTLKQLENIHQKLKLIVHNGHGFYGNHSTNMTIKGLKALFLESLMKECKWNLFDDIWS